MPFWATRGAAAQINMSTYTCVCPLLKRCTMHSQESTPMHYDRVVAHPPAICVFLLTAVSLQAENGRTPATLTLLQSLL